MFIRHNYKYGKEPQPMGFLAAFIMLVAGVLGAIYGTSAAEKRDGEGISARRQSHSERENRHSLFTEAAALNDSEHREFSDHQNSLRSLMVSSGHRLDAEIRAMAIRTGQWKALGYSIDDLGLISCGSEHGRGTERHGAWGSLRAICCIVARQAYDNLDRLCYLLGWGGHGACIQVISNDTREKTKRLFDASDWGVLMSIVKSQRAKEIYESVCKAALSLAYACFDEFASHL